MVIHLRARPSRIALSIMMLLSFLVVSWAALRPWVAKRTLSQSPIDEAARRALALDPDNNRVQATLAALYHYSLLLRDYHAALAAYHAILRNNPLDSVSWVHLGKLYESLGQAPETDRAFHLATQLSPSNAALLWEIAVAYLDRQQAPQAVDTLARFLSAADNPSDLAKGYDLARSLLTPEEVLNTFIPPAMPHYTSYANYLLDRNLGDQALPVWNGLADLAARTGEPIDPHLQLRVVDLLIRAGQLGPAHQLWTAVTQQMGLNNAPTQSNPISNGSFERETTIGRGFDWRIGGAPGVTAALDPFMAYTGRRALRLSFTKSRADFFNVSQPVAVEPYSTYAVQAHIRTDSLNGPAGIAVEVIDTHGTVLARTDTIGGTRDWTSVAAQFHTSSAAGTITIRIHSDPPPPYLPPISGSAWIDNVSLKKTE